MVLKGIIFYASQGSSIIILPIDNVTPSITLVVLLFILIFGRFCCLSLDKSITRHFIGVLINHAVISASETKFRIHIFVVSMFISVKTAFPNI